MTSVKENLRLPDYEEFKEAIAPLALEMSACEVHGIMCAYVCAGADEQGEAYLRALTGNKKDASTRIATLALFAVFTVSQQQMANFDFEFQLLLPDDDHSLVERAKAFSDWCRGFTENLTDLGVRIERFYDEDVQDSVQHLREFGELDYDALDIDEEDERALIEVSEYTRMTVMHLYDDLVITQKKLGGSETAH